MTAIILVLGCDSVCGLRPHTLSHPWHYSMLSFRVKRGIPIIFFSAFILYSIVIHSFASANNNGGYYLYMPPDSIYTADTLRPDTSEDKLQYPFPDNEGYPFSSTDISSPLYLNNPSNIKSDVEYNDKTGEYDFNEKIGEQYYRYPNSMTLEEYKNYDFDHAIRDYWNQKSSSESFSHQKSLLPTLHFGGEIFDRIFGSNVIDIRPQGSATLTFGIDISRVENPQLQERLRKTWTFNFEEQIEMNVTGQIGDKLKLACNYNTEASFEFENKMNLAYQGKEDEIIQKIEAGDVTLPLTGSLITGSQSLFGLKTELQFGRLTATSVFSQQKGKTSVIEVEGGATTNYFEVNCDDYEANKHFFLAQYFRNKYNDAMKSLPVIASDINITKIEVWITNKTGNYEESRNILSFMDLGEGISEQGVNNVFASNVITQSFQGTPRNESNNIYDVVINPNINNIRIFTGITTAMAPFAQSNFTGGQDYEKIESARLLSSSEYKLNARLGFISLNSALNADEILAVAYEYTTSDGKTYRVGELTPDGVSAPQTLIVKLLKATSLTPRLPTWKLMMKNVYALGAYQVNKEEFYLNIFYNDPKTGTPINYIPEPDIFSGHSLIQVLSLDKLNTQLEAFPDGVFDYIENYTISPSNGRIYFSVLEPFGDDLEKEFGTGNQAISSKYVFHELYDSTQSIARQIAEKNRFILKGSYRSASGSDISLNALNVPQGSVVVTASGRTLTENVDYTVDYSLGRVKIINQGLLESGTPIKISLENNSLFSIQSKTLLGTHLNYRISKNFNLGGTILRLTERPLTQKVNIGDEPISNTIWGIDGTYRTEAPFITKLVDKLPFLETKEASNVTINGEFAHLIPGHSRAIQKEGTAYIDDFEGCKTSLNIQSVSSWELASVPQGQSNIFHGGNRLNSLESGFYRAKLCWYIVERMLVSTTDNNALKNIPDEEKADHFVREVYENEIFPKKESATGIENQQLVLNFSFYPDEKGPYNYNVEGIDSSGNLLAPYSNWGGVMRKVETNDFEASNIEYIEFWLMDPFADPDNDGPKQPINSTGGYLYFHLGNVSEDILNDGRKMFENGLPTSQDISLVDTTIWGRVPMKQSLVTAFDNNPDSRPYQDVGLDGLNDDEENSFFGGGFHNYLENIQLRLTNDAYQKVLQDPSNDNFHYFRGSNQDGDDFESNDFYDNVLERYKKYNGLDGNSPTSKQTVEDYQTQATSAPDVEDINRDNNLSEVESYFQYEVPVFPGMDVGQSYITDKISNPVNVSINGNFIERSVTWYQFKIPIQIPDTVIGSILDFKSIRFIRLLLSGFSQDVVLRFATLDLVRGEWRKYKYSLREGGEWDPGQGDVSTGSFDISAVNIEENGKRDPIKYVLPPGINRVIDPSNPHMRQLNEQSIMLKAGNLPDGDARAAFKNVHLDVRQYKKLKMEVHAEAVGDEALNDGEMRAFIRLGSDYKQNYYEYEVPLTLTPIAVYSDDDNISEDDRLKIWPESNRIDFEFEILQRVKQMRNDEARKLGSLIQPGGYMEIWEGRNRVSINGNPNLSDIRTIMIGIRNPKATNNPHTDDGISKSVEVWFNELRLTDFDEKGGWAATARIATKLADFGTLNIAGNTSRRGFGSIEKKVNERSKEDIYQYDISSNLELGKFFPEKVRLSIPMYVGFSENIQNPQYNPLDPDIPLEAALDNAKTRQERDSIKHISQYYTRRKSLNFTNIKLNSSGGKPKPYSISNFGISYGFNSLDSRDITTEFNHERHYTGGLIYNFNTSPKEFIPFKKVKSKFMKSSWLKLITDFNINFMPNQISMRTDLVRNYRETKLRDIAAADVNVEIPITIKKDFNCNRVYDMKYDLTKGLKFDYNATNISRIVEPQGRVIRRFSNKGGSLDTVYLPYSEWVDSVRGNLINYQAPNDSIKQGWFGANYDFHQSVNVSYNVPVQKLPPFSWITMSARYRGDYDWLSGPLSRPEIGHTIKNSNNSQLNTQFNFLTVYNKIPYLKDLNQKSRRGQQPKKDEKKTEKVRYPEKGREEIKLKANIPKTINHKLNTSDVEMKVFDAQGKPVKGE
ncbi:MAG: cell surface protein SprA, partial [Bacteroidia bacterium]|nr:cell surface protein SprA [Bacteroidia bacterium]